MNASPPGSAGSRRLFPAFLRLGATAFGGLAIIADMRELCVTRKRWLSEHDFDSGVALAQVLPGPTTMHCAAFVGLRVAGPAGAAAAYIGLGLPAFLLMLAASVAHASAASFPAVQAALLGFRFAIIAIVVSAAIDFARAQVKSWSALLIAGVAAALLFLGSQPLLVVAIAALAGMLPAGQGEMPPSTAQSPVESRLVARQVGSILSGALAVGVVLFLWSPPLANLALAMMKIAAVAFGGGYTALPLMHDEFVVTRGALSTVAFMDGVALGQVTPGPIIVAATFVGYQIGGLLAASVATVGIFFPSFILVIAIAPWFGRLQRYPRFRAATRGAALAFVGLLATIALQFAQSVHWTIEHGLLAAAAFVAIRLRIQVLWVMVVSGLLAALVPTIFK